MTEIKLHSASREVLSFRQERGEETFGYERLKEEEEANTQNQKYAAVRGKGLWENKEFFQH